MFLGFFADLKAEWPDGTLTEKPRQTSAFSSCWQNESQYPTAGSWGNLQFSDLADWETWKLKSTLQSVFSISFRCWKSWKQVGQNVHSPSSLVPRSLPHRRGPGTHYVRMRVITLEFQGDRILLQHVHILLTSHVSGYCWEWSNRLCMRSRQLETSLCPFHLNRRPVFDGKDAFVWLPTRSGKFICLPFIFLPFICLTRSQAETTALLSLFFSNSLQCVQLTFALWTNVLRQTIV